MVFVSAKLCSNTCHALIHLALPITQWGLCYYYSQYYYYHFQMRKVRFSEIKELVQAPQLQRHGAAASMELPLPLNRTVSGEPQTLPAHQRQARLPSPPEELQLERCKHSEGCILKVSPTDSCSSHTVTLQGRGRWQERAPSGTGDDGAHH